MTDEQKEARAAKAAEAAKKRSQEVEKTQLAEIASVWDHVSEDDRRVFDYIRKEIPKRKDSGDVAYLRETRALYFRKYRTHLKKEDIPA